MLQSTTTQEDPTAENLLERLSDLERHPEEALVPYEEFSADEKIYYFTPGGFLYRKDPGGEDAGATSAATSPTRFGTTEPTIVKPHA